MSTLPLTYQGTNVQLTPSGTYKLQIVTPPQTPSPSSVRDLFGIKREYLRSIKWFKEGTDIASLDYEEALSIDDLIDDCFETKDFHRLLKIANEQPINVAHYIGLHIISYYLDEEEPSSGLRSMLSNVLTRACADPLYGEHIISPLAELNLSFLEESSYSQTEKKKLIDQTISYASAPNSPYAVAFALVQSIFPKQEKPSLATPSTTPTFSFQRRLYSSIPQSSTLPISKDILSAELGVKYRAWATEDRSLTIPEITEIYNESKKDHSSEVYAEMRELLKIAAEIVCARLDNATYLQTSTSVEKAQAYGIAIDKSWAYQHCRVPFPFNLGRSKEVSDILPLDFLVDEKILRKTPASRSTEKTPLAENPHRRALQELMGSLNDDFCPGIAT
jgi:hypothetical protein